MFNPRRPFIATDIIIEYSQHSKHGIVLIKRRNPPYGIALPGGFAEHGLSLEQNAVKEAKEETGLDVIIESPEEPLCVMSNPGRDPRSHVVSVAYIAHGSGVLHAGDDAAGAALYSIPEVIALVRRDGFAFDHSRIIEKYLKRRGYI